MCAFKMDHENFSLATNIGYETLSPYATLYGKYCASVVVAVLLESLHMLIFDIHKVVVVIICKTNVL